jgi:serine/threonine protein kinase
VNDSEDHAIVTDIGEGKVLDTRGIETSAGASYGCSEFRAPEVRGAQGWSSAADVFSFGVLCCKVLELWADVCTSPIANKLRKLVPGLDGEEIVPKEIKKVVEGCLSRGPTERLSIGSVITELDRLSGKFWYEEKGYTSQSALKDEPEELLKQIEWRSLNWRQTLAVARGAIDARVPGEYSTRDSILDDE